MFEPHNNSRLYEGHIPQATLGYNAKLKQFRRKNLEDTTSMVMSPVDILKPDFEVCIVIRSVVVVDLHVWLKACSLILISETIKGGNIKQKYICDISRCLWALYMDSIFMSDDLSVN